MAHLPKTRAPGAGQDNLGTRTTTKQLRLRLRRPMAMAKGQALGLLTTTDRPVRSGMDTITRSQRLDSSRRSVRRRCQVRQGSLNSKFLMSGLGIRLIKSMLCSAGPYMSFMLAFCVSMLEDDQQWCLDTQVQVDAMLVS